jgi:hypothetical protein
MVVRVVALPATGGFVVVVDVVLELRPQAAAPHRMNSAAMSDRRFI